MIIVIPWMTSAVIALFKFPKIVNKIPKAVINKYDAQYGTFATVLRATHGVYIVMPIMKTFRAINVADARRRTNLLLNLQIKANIPWKQLPNADFVCNDKNNSFANLIQMKQCVQTGDFYFPDLSTWNFFFYPLC